VLLRIYLYALILEALILGALILETLILETLILGALIFVRIGVADRAARHLRRAVLRMLM
jgi:hypothetical protein